ncbi:MAG: hypothetical protein RMH75_04795 [Archaeoglobaceae archaeon]|nr:hypothetical protein [Archaeoglobaceae archaeon]
MIPTNIDDFINFLKNLGIEILDYQKLESGGEGYTVVYVSNLDTKSEDILKLCGFSEAKSDLWFIEGFEASIDNLSESETFLNYFMDLEAEKWQKIIEIRQALDEKQYTQKKENLFRTTHNTPLIAVKWSGRLTLNEPEFKDLLVDLYKIFLEGSNMETEDKLFRCLRYLRNTFIAHDSSKTDQIMVAKDYLRRISGDESPKKWYQFLSAQLNLLEDLYKSLENLKSQIEKISDDVSKA